MRLVSTDWYLDHICKKSLPYLQIGFALMIYQPLGQVYHTHRIKIYLLLDDDPDYVDKLVQEPKGEHKLHYEVVSYIRNNYRNHLIIAAGLGEHQLMHFSRMDSCAK